MFKPYAGGYNDPAPYKTTHLRVPVPIKPYLEKLSVTYKFAVRMQDQVIIDKFVNSLKRFASNYKPVDEEPFEDSTESIHAANKQLQDDIVLLQNTITHLQDRINIMEYNNREARAILQESLKLKQIRATAVKKQVEEALRFID